MGCFVRDTHGQDLVEYALLAAFIGIAGYIVLGAIGVEVFTTYESWIDPSVGTPSIWDTPEPISSS